MFLISKSSTCKTLLIDTLMEEVKPKVMNELEIEYRAGLNIKVVVFFRTVNVFDSRIEADEMCIQDFHNK